jgi:hypothetical protein
MSMTGYRVHILVQANVRCQCPQVYTVCSSPCPCPCLCPYPFYFYFSCHMFPSVSLSPVSPVLSLFFSALPLFLSLSFCISSSVSTLYLYPSICSLLSLPPVLFSLPLFSFSPMSLPLDFLLCLLSSFTHLSLPSVSPFYSVSFLCLSRCLFLSPSVSTPFLWPSVCLLHCLSLCLFLSVAVALSLVLYLSLCLPHFPPPLLCRLFSSLPLVSLSLCLFTLLLYLLCPPVPLSFRLSC